MYNIEQFGWEVIGERKLPFIYRIINDIYLKYVSKRMVHTQLLSYYLNFLPHDLLKYISIKCDYITINEARLFNSINKKYCDHIYLIGSEPFKAYVDCVFHVDDVKELYKFIVACYKKKLVSNYPSSNNKYGYVRINFKYLYIVLYYIIDYQNYISLFFFYVTTTY